MRLFLLSYNSPSRHFSTDQVSFLARLSRGLRLCRAGTIAAAVRNEEGKKKIFFKYKKRKWGEKRKRGPVVPFGSNGETFSRLDADGGNPRADLSDDGRGRVPVMSLCPW